MTLLLTFLHLAFLSAIDGPLHFENSFFDFGDRAAEEKVLECDFCFTNVSDKDVSISYAVASCTCTQVSWPHEPVAPGAEGKIHIAYTKERYDNEFRKSVTVKTDGGSSYILSFAGKFHDTALSLAQDFNYRRSVLCLTSDSIDLGVLTADSKQNGRIEFGNFSDKTITLSFEDISPGLLLSCYHTDLEPYSRTYITYYFVADSAVRGSITYSFIPAVDGVPLGPYEIKAIIVDDFSGLSSLERNTGAFPKLSASDFEFNSVQQGENASVNIGIYNSSDAPMIIEAVFGNRPGISFSYPETIEARESGSIEAIISSDALHVGVNRFIVGIVTNSPSIPYLKTSVTGYVK